MGLDIMRLKLAKDPSGYSSRLYLLMNHNTSKSEPLVMICYVWNMFSCWDKTNSHGMTSISTICLIYYMFPTTIWWRFALWMDNINHFMAYIRDLCKIPAHSVFLSLYKSVWNLPYYQLSSKKNTRVWQLPVCVITSDGFVGNREKEGTLTIAGHHL